LLRLEVNNFVFNVLGDLLRDLIKGLYGAKLCSNVVDFLTLCLSDLERFLLVHPDLLLLFYL